MQSTQLVPGGGGQLLLLSMRRMSQLVAYCVDYEFEDVIGDLTAADRVDVCDAEALEWSRRIYKYTRFVSGARRGAGPFAGPHATVRLERDYELFFPVFNQPYELFALAAIPDWRKRCKVAACFISELWLHQFPGYLLELLAPFDHIFIGVSNPVSEVTRLVGKPCSYLPLAADVLKFAPYPLPPERSIGLCNIGRRSAVTHAALLQVANDQKFFYYYDTVAASGFDMKQRTFRVQNAREHRLLLASLMRRSRYCFAHRGFVNDPNSNNGVDEISSRIYEGAAAGVVMLGEPPRSAAFQQQFDWPDHLIPVPFDCAEIGRVLKDLDSDPQRLATIRTQNVRNSALRHDWGQRLRTVFDTLGLAPTDKMRERELLLQKVSEQVIATA
jgi:Glycosyl transferases group 1